MDLQLAIFQKTLGKGGTERPPILEGIQHAGQQTLFGVTAAVAM